MDFTQADKERWEKIKSKGRVRFGLIYGIILGVLNYFIIHFEELWDGSFGEVLLSWKSWLILLILIVLNSFLFGWFSWWAMEKGFSKDVVDKNTPEKS